MKAVLSTILVAVCALPLPLSLPRAAQAQNPVSNAFRMAEERQGKNLMDAAEEMPADRYGYKPTPAQMSFGDVVAHLVEGNDYLCGAVSGQKAPERGKIQGADPKDKLVGSLKDSFQFCASALAHVQDAQLGDTIPFFGGRKVTRAAATLITVADWADHYSQAAIYLRLNQLLPPTAKQRSE